MESTSSSSPSTSSDNSDGMRSWLIGVVSSVAILATLLVGLRLISRRLAHQNLWWDDWVILLSMCWNLLCVGFFISAMYSQGLGFHVLQVQPDHIVRMAQLLLAAEIMYAWNLCLTKVSILFLFSRTFRALSARSRAYLWATGSLVVIWAITATFIYVFMCVPVQKIWDPSLPGTCMDQTTIWIVTMIPTVVTDLAILLFPIPQIWALTFRPIEKVALAIVFAQGLFVVFTSAYRFRTLFQYTISDPTYSLAPVVAWTEIEIAAGMIAACLPVLRPIMSLLLTCNGAREPVRKVDLNNIELNSHQSSRRKDSSWRTNKLSASDSGTPLIPVLMKSPQLASRPDAWEWEQNMERATRQSEMCVVESEVVSSGRRCTPDGEEEGDFPENGICITTEFRRWSAAAPMP